MTKLNTSIDTGSSEYAENLAAMSALVAELREKAAVVAQGGSKKSRERHVGRGKLLPRERVNTLLDPGTPFLELGQFAAWGMYDGAVPSAGIITGMQCDARATAIRYFSPTLWKASPSAGVSTQHGTPTSGSPCSVILSYPRIRVHRVTALPESYSFRRSNLLT